MQLIHTSPTKIEKITPFGRFDSFLFFSCDEYVMTAGDFVTYSIEIDENDIIEAESLYYHEKAELLEDMTRDIAERAGCDESTAEDLISQRESLWDMNVDLDTEEKIDLDFDIQLCAARAAQLLGFRGVEMDDEQGRAWMINMEGREHELEIQQEKSTK